MNRIRITQLTVIGVSAILTIGAVGTARADQSAYTMARPGMWTGVTHTVTTAPTTLQVPLAIPRITGPAALPPEERGLPGD